MASIELPRRAYSANPGDGQAHEEPQQETRRRASAQFLAKSKTRKAWSLCLSRLPALKGLPFSPVLAPHCDVRDYSVQWTVPAESRFSFSSAALHDV
jgi:hypothetical protein